MDAGQTAIRVHETQPSKPSRPKGRASAIPLIKKMIRPLTYTIVGAMVVSVGLGAWSYFGSQRQTEESDSIAELDSFEFPAPASDSSRDGKQSSSVPLRKISATGTANERAMPNGTKDPVLVNRQDRYTAVWLTGTIEEVERNDPAESIRRVSGGRGESTNLR